MPGRLDRGRASFPALGYGRSGHGSASAHTDRNRRTVLRSAIFPLQATGRSGHDSANGFAEADRIALYLGSLWRLAGGNEGSDRVGHFVVFGVSAGFLLGVDKLVANDHLVDTARRRDQREAAEVVLEFPEQLINHAHGTVFVPSSGAVLDTEIHSGEDTSSR